MRKFNPVEQAQQFLRARSAVFSLGRHLVSAENYRFLRQRAFAFWK